MPKRVYVEHRRGPDGTQLRNVLTPNGKTRVGVKSFVANPDGEHQAWLFMRPGEKEAHALDNSQAIRNARNKARRETEPGKPSRTSLPLRSEALGVGCVGLNMGKPLGSGPDRVKARKALSLEVRRAEQSVKERDAVNAKQKAYDQVKVRCLSPPPPNTTHVLSVPTTKLITHSSFDGPRSTKQRRSTSSTPSP